MRTKSLIGRGISLPPKNIFDDILSLALVEGNIHLSLLPLWHTWPILAFSFEKSVIFITELLFKLSPTNPVGTL